MVYSASPRRADFAGAGQRRVTVEDLQPSTERDVRNANIAIIEGNEASQFGIGMVSARIALMVLRDEGEVIPIGSYVAKYGVTLSLPSIVGRQCPRRRRRHWSTVPRHYGTRCAALAFKGS